MESKESKNQATPVVPPNVGRRRLSLSQNDVRAIFACIQNLGPPPDSVPFRIIVVPKFGGSNGMKLSPPPYQYQDGVYVLLRPHVGIYSALTDRVMLHHDLALIPECPWGLSGPQYSGESVDLQQRYCTPKGKDSEYRSSTKGAIWTMIDSDGKEHYDCRVFVVYHGAPKRTAMSPRTNKRSPLLKQPSPKPRVPDPDVQKSSDNVDAPLRNGIGAELASSHLGNMGLPPGVAVAGSSVFDAIPKGPKKKPKGRKRSRKSSDRTGKARQVTRIWRTEEDVQLAELVEQEPDLARIAWNVLARSMENRSGKQCRERYINHLRPDRKKGKWTEAEDDHILQLQAALGNQWSKIAAALPGRSDNDVKNRWHSRMRSHKRKYEKVAYDDPGTGDAEEKENRAAAKQGRKRRSKATQLKSFDSYWPDSIGSNADLAMDEAPKIGQRVKVKLAGGKIHEGTITSASQKVGLTQEQRYSVMIHFDDGASLEAVLPNKDIHLDPTSNVLSENEVLLCHELINLHNTLKNPDGAGQRKKDQASEEESHMSSKNISEDSQEGPGPPRRSGRDDSSETGANGSTTETEGLETKQPADGNEDEGGTKPSPQASASEASGDSDSAAATAGPLLAVAPRSAATEAPFLHPPTPTAANFPAHAAFQHHAPAPFFALPNQQQQLIAAAQLLSSVSPGLAVAAISQASRLHSLGVRGQAPVFFPPPAPGGGFQQRLANFAMPPLGALPIPGRDANWSSHALPGNSSMAERK